MKVSDASDIEVDQKSKDIISEEISNIIEELIDDYIKDVVDVFSNHLTDDELNAFYNFYRSPEGISLGGKMVDEANYQQAVVLVAAADEIAARE